MDENLDLNKNIEIEKALQEFEEKSSTEETQKPPEAGEASDIPKMTRLVMKWSGVKEQRQAEYILIPGIHKNLHFCRFVVVSIYTLKAWI